ncbi:MAG TPA: hypothetical protein PKH92_11665 [Anaerolineaceae bacterium]|nr:hypothetical protein [Anaerolineaceae bacterium]HQF61238.1 hypothetical protein [Anaerolineaceae bacterium]HQH84379.1 hypothetical protein [Anaerolineaceae bacterium]
MLQKISIALDDLSEYFSQRKGLLPLIGIILILINFVLSQFPLGWISESDLFLHLGVIVAIFGFMLAWAL